jgi:hypothetical protein
MGSQEKSLTSALYAGRPLLLDDSFRLAQVQPGNRDDPISVRLVSARLSAPPEYEALSYTWGDRRTTEVISVSGDEDLSQRKTDMQVTTNCHSALKRLRRTDAPRMLWVDFICINQPLIAERNHQLSLMAQIYARASRVVVYLGEGTEESDEAMDTIREIDEPSELVDEDRIKFTQHELWFQDGRGPNNVAALLDRPWFSRIWVLQEIAAARDALVCCGDREVSWESFRAFRHYNVATNWIQRLPYAVQHSVLRVRGGDVVLPKRLHQRLSTTRRCGATDPRDKLFAVLPLLDREQQLRSEQSSSSSEPTRVFEGLPKSISTYDQTPALVFTNLAIYLFEHLGVDVLRDVIGPSSMEGLPTWAPDWSIAPASTYAEGLYALTEDFSTGFKDKPRRKWGGDLDQPPKAVWSYKHLQYHELRIDAVNCGVITAVGSVCDVEREQLPLEEWRALVPDQKYLEKTEVEYHRAGETTKLLSPFSILLVREDVIYPDAIRRAVRMLVSYQKDRDQYCEHNKDLYRRRQITELRLKDVLKALPPSYRRQAERIFETCEGRRFIVTDSGRIGLAPAETKEGDIVFALAGATVPFVLRGTSLKNESGAQLFRLVGECTVLDIMRGEAFQDASKVERVTII